MNSSTPKTVQAGLKEFRIAKQYLAEQMLRSARAEFKAAFSDADKPLTQRWPTTSDKALLTNCSERQALFMKN